MGSTSVDGPQARYREACESAFQSAGFGPTGGSDYDLTASKLAATLQDTQQGVLIQILGSHRDETMTVEDLAHALALNHRRYDRNGADSMSMGGSADEIKTALQNDVLPQLENLGIVRWVGNRTGREVVRAGENMSVAFKATMILAEASRGDNSPAL